MSKKKPNDKERLLNIKQNLEQAKVSGNKLQIKIWTDVLKKLEDRINNNK